MAQRKKLSKLDVIARDYINSSGLEREKMQKIVMANYKLAFKSEPIIDDWKIIFSMMDKCVAELKKTYSKNKKLASNFKFEYKKLLSEYAKNPEERDKETLIAGVKKVLELNRNLNDSVAKVNTIFEKSAKEIITPYYKTHADLARNLVNGMHMLRLAIVENSMYDKGELIKTNLLSTIGASQLSDYRKRKVRESLQKIDSLGITYLEKLENSKPRQRKSPKTTAKQVQLFNYDDYSSDEDEANEEFTTRNKKMQDSLYHLSGQDEIDDALSPEITHNERRLNELKKAKKHPAKSVDTPILENDDELETHNRNIQKKLDTILNDEFDIIDAYRSVTKNQMRQNMLANMRNTLPPHMRTYTDDSPKGTKAPGGSSMGVSVDDTAVDTDTATDTSSDGPSRIDSSDFDIMCNALEQEFAELERNPSRENPWDLKVKHIPFERIRH